MSCQLNRTAVEETENVLTLVVICIISFTNIVFCVNRSMLQPTAAEQLTPHALFFYCLQEHCNGEHKCSSASSHFRLEAPFQLHCLTVLLFGRVCRTNIRFVVLCTHDSKLSCFCSNTLLTSFTPFPIPFHCQLTMPFTTSVSSVLLQLQVLFLGSCNKFKFRRLHILSCSEMYLALPYMLSLGFGFSGYLNRSILFLLEIIV